MRALIQRVSSASVSIREGNVNGIDQGYCILLGVGPDDTEEIAEKLWSKISKLRIFEDQDGKTNLSLRDVNGAVLLVSQFTLYADCRKGNRPSFTKGASPDMANRLYEYFAQLVRNDDIELKTGWFGAMMEVSLTNSGPFTLWLDTDNLAKQQNRSRQAPSTTN